MSLPTVDHWKRAAGTSITDAIVPLSNFSGRGLASVGAYQGMGPFGTYDMAGNAKEWCWNEAAAGIRYSMGGAWNEPSYMFKEPDATSAFDRSPANGFRCVKYLDQEQPPTASMQRIIRVRRRDFLKEQPVSDAIFKAYTSAYRYDASPLEAATQSVDDADPRWRKETVSFRAGYGNERVTAHVYLPKVSQPPYQTVIYFPGLYALTLRSNDHTDLDCSLTSSSKVDVRSSIRSTKAHTSEGMRSSRTDKIARPFSGSTSSPGQGISGAPSTTFRREKTCGTSRWCIRPELGSETRRIASSVGGAD